MNSDRCALMAAVGLAVLLGNPGLGVASERPGGATASYGVDPTWPRKPDHLTWGQMPGIVVDAQDLVYLSTRSTPAVQVYRTDGTFVRAWDIKDASGAHYIRVDPEGNIWTTDIKSHLVCKHNPEGKVLLTLGEAGRPGTDEKHFGRPTDVAVLPSGDIFVSDGYDNRRIIHFDRTGKYVHQWGEAGSEPGRFALPHAIVADTHGRLYVADRDNARIQVFDTRGKLLAVWADLITPWGLHLTQAGELWVCGSSPRKKAGTNEWAITPPPDQVVMKLNLKGQVLLRVPLVQTPTPPGKPGELDWVHTIAADSQGHLYLGDIQGQRAQKFSRRP
ncbi:MAG: hypothetical protein FJ280_24235 [Planctomycetes bacterium]|nr:hypothetical protein [Planctomycetota bacterium]